MEFLPAASNPPAAPKRKQFTLKDKYLSLSLRTKLIEMPTFITIFGMRFFFYSGEHLPIHLHVENGDGRAKIQIEPEIMVVENLGIKQKDLRKALTVVKLYKSDIISMWNEYFSE